MDDKMENRLLRNFIRESIYVSHPDGMLKEQSTAGLGILLSTNPANAPDLCKQVEGRTGDQFLAMYVGGILAGSAGVGAIGTISFTGVAAACTNVVRVIGFLGNAAMAANILSKVYEIFEVLSHPRASDVEKEQKAMKILFEIFVEIALFVTFMKYSKLIGNTKQISTSQISIPKGTGPLAVAASITSKIASFVVGTLKDFIHDMPLTAISTLIYLNLEDISTRFAEEISGNEMQSYIEQMKRIEEAEVVADKEMIQLLTKLDEESYTSPKTSGKIAEIEISKLPNYINCVEDKIKPIYQQSQKSTSKSELQQIQDYFKSFYPYLAPRIKDVATAKKYSMMSHEDLSRLNFNVKMGLDSGPEIRSAP